MLRGEPAADAKTEAVAGVYPGVTHVSGIDLRKVVGATGFEPATPCAQGKLGRGSEALISE